MGNLVPPMIGNLLTLITAIGALGLAAAALENLLARRVPVRVRSDQPAPPADDAR